MGLIAGVLAVLTGVAVAAPPPVPSPFGVDAEQRLAKPLARAVERAALLDLRMRERALPSDYEIAALVLGHAARVDPDNPELHRRVAAAAFAAQDERRYLDATRQVIRLDPEDTVAQLRLITANVARLQTAEERLAAYDRYLGPRGDRLDPSVRSRLALDAALLLRETGDVGGFVERLTQATALDGTNKDAAALALRFAEERGTDPAGLLELQINVLMSDPLDPHVHRAMAGALARQGAYAAARRSLGSSIAIADRHGQAFLDLTVERMALDAVLDGPGPVVREIEGLLTALRAQAQAERDRAEAQALPESEWPDPEQTRLPIPLERLRFVLADLAGESEVVAASLADLEATIGAAAEQLSELTQDGDLAGSPELLGEFLRLFMILQSSRAVTGVDLDKLDADVAQFAQTAALPAEFFSVLDPWKSLHAGDDEGALAQASRVADPSAVALLSARALERLGRQEEATQAYLAAARLNPYEPFGVWAAVRAARLAGEDALLTEPGRRMSERAGAIPEWVGRMINQPSSYMSLSAEPASRTIGPDEEATVRITLVNIAPVPLSVGADRVISSRMLLTPGLDDSIEGFVGVPQPEVLELDRRLRLEPRRPLVADLPADPGYTGWLIDLNARLTIRQRWRVLQSFQMGRYGAIESGPLALTAETGPVRRLSLPEARLTPDELAMRLDRDDPVTLPRTVGGVLALLMGPRESEALPRDELDRLTQALVRRYDRAGPVERAYMLAVLPTGRQAPSLSAFDRHVVTTLDSGGARAHDGLVAALALLTRVPDPASPAFEVVASSGLPDLERLGTLLRARLSPGQATLATAGPDVRALAGPTPGAVRAVATPAQPQTSP